MSADIDVLVATTSPISFSSSYLPFGPRSDFKKSSADIVRSSPLACPRTSSLTFPSVLGSSPSILLGHSPPIFSSSPPTHLTFHGRCSSPTLAFPTLRRLSPAVQMPVAVPRRPCLVVRYEEPLAHFVNLPSPNKNKKKVVFADDRGFPLTKVRTMTEPSNMPPRWSFQFLAQVTQGAIAEVAPEPWEAAFPQPASDYLDFRRRIDTGNVSLENVIVRETEQSVVGTVKVRNLAFNKEVFVRVTSDSWNTHEDTFCTYVKNVPAAHGVTVLYDTFSFRLTLPPRSRRLEFCVCFRCEGTEYWDNNAGKNYVIKKKEFPENEQKSFTPPSPRPITFLENKINLAHKFSDGRPDAHIDSWSEFASWNHLHNDTPYW